MSRVDCVDPRPGGVADTRLDRERLARLIDDVEQRLFGALPDDTGVNPGHTDDTTIGAQRPHLAQWRAPSRRRGPVTGHGAPTWGAPRWQHP